MNTEDHSRLWNQSLIQVMDIRQWLLRPDEEWTPYRLPTNCFLYSFRGKANIRLDGTTYTADRFHVVHGGKGMELDIRLADDAFAFYLIFYKAELAGHRLARQSSILHEHIHPFYIQYGFCPPDPLKLFQLVTKLNEQWLLSGPLERLSVKSVLYQFVHELLTQLRMQTEHADKTAVVTQLARHIHDHFAEPITLEGLAQQFSYSPRYLTRLFRQEMGRSPIDYVIQVRIEKAKELLLCTDATLQEIAASVGYADHHYFNRLFKKHTGVTPGQFQRSGKRLDGAPFVPDRPTVRTGLSIVARKSQRYIVTDNDYQHAFGGTIRMNRRSKHSFAFLLFCSFAVMLSACANTTAPTENAAGSGSATTAPAAAERVLTDALGHEVKVPPNPQRIIASYLEDHLVALGVKPVAQWSVKNGQVQDYLQKDLAGVPLISFDLPYEAVMSFQPDLIIMDSADTVAGDKYAQYAKIAPTYTVGNAKNNDWRQELLTVGEVLGKQAEAQKALDGYEKKAKDAKEQLQAAIGSKSAAVLWVTEKSVYVVSEHLSSGDVLYHDLGFGVPDVVQEISKTGTANWNAISLEKISNLQADYLFIVNSADGIKEKIMHDPVWAGIPAVKNDHVFAFDKNSSWLYTGTIANTQIIDDVLKSVGVKQ